MSAPAIAQTVVSEQEPLVATPSQTAGPFFHVGLPPTPNGHMAGRLPADAAISLILKVTDGDGEPVTDALVELCQAGAFARMPTGDDGTCEFHGVRPASHINVCVFARGLLRQLHTRIYFADDAALTRDPVLALVPEDRRATLMAFPDDARPAAWRFHVRLQGAQETVFFDV